MRWREWVLAAVGVFLVAHNWSFLQNISAHATDEMGFGRGWTDTEIVTGACTAPMSVFPPIEEEPGTAAVIFHGLGANRKIMALLGRWVAARGMTVYAVDLPGHGDSREGFSFPAVETCARAVLEQLTQEGKITPDRTALIGHSMGGAIAMRMADSFSAAATIAISPAPLRSPSRLPDGLVLFDPPNHVPRNLLIFTGQFDPPVARRSVEEYLKRVGVAADGGQGGSGENRGVEWRIVPMASHTSQLFDREVWQGTTSWIEGVLEYRRSVYHHYYAGIEELIEGLLGVFLCFPLGATIAGLAFGMRLPRKPQKELRVAIWWMWGIAVALTIAAIWVWREFIFSGLPWDGLWLYQKVVVVVLLSLGWQEIVERVLGRGATDVLPIRALHHVSGVAGILRWVVAAGVGVVVCYFWLPVGWVRLFTGDYLASFVLVVGVVLCVWQSRTVREMTTGVIETPPFAEGETGAPDKNSRVTPALHGRGMTEWRAVAVGVVVGMGTILAIGWWLNLGLYDAWMNGPRWWRFFVLVGAFLPYVWAEERAVGMVGREAEGGRSSPPAADEGRPYKGSEEKRRATLKSRPYMGEAGFAGWAKRWGAFLLMRGILWGAMVFSLVVLLRGPLLVLLMTMYLILFSVLQRAGANVIRRWTGSAAAAAVFSAILAAWMVASVMPIV